MEAPRKFKVAQPAVDLESHDDAQVTSGPLGFAALPPKRLFVAGVPFQSLTVRHLVSCAWLPCGEITALLRKVVLTVGEAG